MKKVLIIDDSWVARLKLGSMVKAAGYDVMEADSGEKGLTLLSKDAPDLILLDLLMPGIGGIETLKEMKQQGWDIPVVIVTADIQESTRIACIKEGAIEVINKPPAQEKLIECLRSILQHPASEENSHGSVE